MPTHTTKRGSVRPWMVAAIVFFGTSTVLLSSGMIWRDSGAEREDRASARQPREVEGRGRLTAGERNTVDLYERVSPSVVHIRTHLKTTNPRTLNISESAAGSGSGIIWNDRGYIVTNAHILEEGEALAHSGARVTLADGSEYEAKLIDIRPEFDIAVLLIDAPKEKLVAIPVGSSNDLLVGQSVFAIGNPFGLDHSLATGVISGLQRRIVTNSGVPVEGAIQTDAAINPGNSGGPLLDSSGRLIGLNTALHARAETSAGVGFAIPVDMLNVMVPRAISEGAAPWPELGLVLAPDLASEKLGIAGVLVILVEEDGPAANAGLEHMLYRGTEPAKYDYIVAIDGEDIVSRSDVERIVSRKSVGDTIRVRYIRLGHEFTTDIELVEGD